jgi:hypothetical protein
VLSFDVGALRKYGVTIAPPPDERGRLIDVRTLPARFAGRLKQDGLDTSKPLRVVGVIPRLPSGAPGPYLVRFEQTPRSPRGGNGGVCATWPGGDLAGSATIRRCESFGAPRSTP